MICPYCFSKLDLTSDLKKCDVCNTYFSERISKNLTNDDISLTLIGARKSGKTTFLSVLFYYIESLLTQKTDINYEYLDDRGFSYVFDNINKLKYNEMPTATGLNFDTLSIVLFRNFFYKKFIFSFLDTPGEVMEKEEYLLNLEISNKIFKSQNIFMLIDIEHFFNDECMFYTGFISRFLNLREKKGDFSKQNLYLIFTKSDKVYNFLHKYSINEYVSFYNKLKKSDSIDLEETYKKLDYFSDKMKFIISQDKKKNFFNILENNFNNFYCFLVSSLGEENKFNKEKEFGVLNPLIHLVGKNYNSEIIIQLKKVVKNIFERF
jgi:GTPase SAR1 family protein